MIDYSDGDSFWLLSLHSTSFEYAANHSTIAMMSAKKAIGPAVKSNERVRLYDSKAHRL